VARQQADLFTRIGQTFTPLSEHTAALQAAITGGPPALRTAAQQLPQQSRFISDTASLFHRFRPAFRSLGAASAQLAPAEAAGIQVLPRTPALNRRLTQTLEALQGFAFDQRTLPGLGLLTETARLIEPTVAFIEPAQTRCNYLALFFRNLENALSESDQVGTMLGVTALALPQLPNSEAGPSSAPADGPPASGNLIQQNNEIDSYLHSDPYPYTASSGQPAECEAGNERYVSGRQMIGTAPVSATGTDRTRRVLP
jgi:ABC-type transporter Mla subunit MlaD